MTWTCDKTLETWHCPQRPKTLLALKYEDLRLDLKLEKITCEHLLEKSKNIKYKDTILRILV